MKTLYITVGIPGCGKSTWAEKMGVPIISTDEIRREITGDASNQDSNRIVFDLIIPQRLKKALEENDVVIYDATSYNRKNRTLPLKIAKPFRDAGQLKVIGKVFNTPLGVCKQRNKARARVVPEHVLDRMHANFEVPSLEEGFDKIEFINS